MNTKVLFFDVDTFGGLRSPPSPYDRERHTHHDPGSGSVLLKFLYWNDGGNGYPLFLCGYPIAYGALLKGASLYLKLPSTKPDGVGCARAMDNSGRVAVTSWDNNALNVTTGIVVRRKICAVLGIDENFN